MISRQTTAFIIAETKNKRHENGIKLKLMNTGEKEMNADILIVYILD